MAFSIKTRGRCWMVTIHIENMKKAGLSEEEIANPEVVANHFIKLWEKSGKERQAAISVCLSKEGCYHAHMACYGNTTTLRKVSEVLSYAHVEPQLGGKDELTDYILARGKYSGKDEEVLYSSGIEVIQNNQGKRNDLQEMEELLNSGLKPDEIFEQSFRYRKYERMVKSAYINKKINNVPLIKENLQRIWIVGESGTGKSYYYKELADAIGEENIYFTTDYDNGGLDFYVESGAPETLFLDEFKGNMRFSDLLVILDKYSKAQMHCRYSNCYCLWNSVIITSVYPPDEVYEFMVKEEKRGRDSIKQLLRRLDEIWYKYKTDEGYKTYIIPASEYTNYEELKQRALSENGFTAIESADIPF